MDAVKTTFSIKDLENLGGVKAHTIRIWEKRYNLLDPERTPTNIRTYSLKDLQKLLNVTFLLENKYKISKVARHTSTEIAEIVKEIISKKNEIDNYHAINSFKIAMMNFDQQLFSKTYRTLCQELSFREIFYQAFIPLLEEIGLLWQTGTISPAHEHFISNLIKQKILIKIEQHQLKSAPTKSKTFVLFLPENEIHELGLMWLNYEITVHDYKCIYLGQSIQIESLKYLATHQPNIKFVSYFTVKPEDQTIKEYTEDFNKLLGKEFPFYILGRLVQKEKQADLPSNVKILKTIEEFAAVL
tara:strand:- start:1557 stop:2456 length:900 start_codon:yes stop_codon:yes gene_type:complete